MKAKIKIKTDACKWAEDEDGIWQTDCGNSFVLNNDTPAKNSMQFCCYCGCKLKQVLLKT